MALDTYFRGNSAETEFCSKVGAGGNHLVAATAGGKKLGDKSDLRLRERELAAALDEFHGLPAEEQRPKLPDFTGVEPPKRPVPKPPAGGLVLRGYCTYLRTGEDGRPDRSTVYYYEQNPDRWAVETQSDMLWLTADERKSLIPARLAPGERVEVSEAIRQRLFSTVGIDYMEGSVNSLPMRESTMTITVEKVTPSGADLRLEGRGLMGKPFDEHQKGEARTRGCELRILGKLHYDAKEAAFDRFDVVGIGRAWGCKMEYTRREMRIDGYPWLYGVTLELVTGDAPIDRIPPYNLLHYNGSGAPYFPD